MSTATAPSPVVFIPAQRTAAPRIDVSVFQSDRESFSLRRRDAVDVLSGMYAGGLSGFS